MPHPEVDTAQKRNTYGIKKEVLLDMIAKWEPFINNRLIQKSASIQEQKEEEEQ